MLNRIKDKIKDILLIENKNEKIKEWLERNKIYFETIVMVSLTIMSLVISRSANIIANRSNDLAEKANEIADRSNEISETEIEMQQKDKLPSFTVKIEENQSSNIVNTVNIYNTGGRITNGFINTHCYVKIYLKNANGKTSNWWIKIYDAFEDTKISYDYNNECFSLKSYLSSFVNMYYDVKREIDLENIDLSYRTYELFNISYVNYFEESCEEYYCLSRIDALTLEEIDKTTYNNFLKNEDDYVWCNGETWSEKTINESKDKLKTGIQNMIAKSSD